MVSELDTGLCASEDIGLWKSLPSISASGRLEHYYKWYLSQTSGCVLVRTLGLGNLFLTYLLAVGLDITTNGI